MKIITALLLSLTLSTAMASEVGYEVEVIIFEDITGKFVGSEQWLNMSERALGEEYIQEQADEVELSSQKPGYRINFMPGENYLLNDQVTKLLKHPEYKIHVHKVWKQPGLDKDMAIAFEINSQEQLLDSSKYLDENERNASESKTLEEGEAEIPFDESYVDGSVTLIMSRYLHFNTNLVLHRTFDETVLSYPINSERRMKSRETHYIDHPMVGVIVIATPFKILTEEDKRKPIGTYRTL